MISSWSMVFEPVDHGSTYEATVARLGTAIRIGVLPAGTRLPPERELAEQLCISRSTLRQALATLTDSGHLLALRGRSGGTFVAADPPATSAAPFSAEELRPLLDWWLALELGIVHLAAERADDADCARLNTALAVLEQSIAGGFAAYRRADAGFHLALAEAARSPRLLAAEAEVQDRLSDALVAAGVPAPTREEDVEQYRQVVDAVQRGDVVEAVIAMRSHLATVEHLLAETPVA